MSKEQKIAEIVDSIVPVICHKSECGECDECDVLIKDILALIASEQQPMVEALKDIQGVTEVELSEYIGVEVPYVPMRLLVYKQIYNIADAALKGEGK